MGSPHTGNGHSKFCAFHGNAPTKLAYATNVQRETRSRASVALMPFSVERELDPPVAAISSKSPYQILK